MPSESPDYAEKSLLGAMVRDNQVIGDVVQLVRKDFFRLAAHQMLFDGIVSLWDAGKAADMVTLAELLKARGQIEDVGGYAYIGELWEVAPTSANAEHYAGIVRDHGLTRQVYSTAMRIADEAQQHRGPADEILAEAEREILALADVGATGQVVTLAQAVSSAFERIDQRATSEGASGLPTGLKDLDLKLGGLRDSELIILAARPGVGKTTLALQIARRASECVPVFFASLEQPHQELAERLLAAESGIDGHKLRLGTVAGMECQRLSDVGATLSKRPIFIDDLPSQTTLRIAANARRLKQRHKVGLVIVDYLQLIQAEDRKLPRHEQVASMSRRLKILARELNIPVIALSQLNRASENRTDREPRLADLRESGAVEQDADVAILLHQPSETEPLITANVAKHRNGPTGKVTLFFRAELTRFENFAPEEPAWRPKGNGRAHYAVAD